MNFQVDWSQVALNNLSAAWLQADPEQRRAITAAASQIDAKLRNDARETGESRSGGQRVYLEKPLGVSFKVNVRLRRVLITQAWVFRTH